MADDTVVDMFTAITGATPEVARRYLGFTENNAEQAIQLYFDSPDLAGTEASQPPPPPIPASTRPPRASSHIPGAIIDSDGESMDEDNEGEDAAVAAVARAADAEDDEAMARRIQDEMYAGGDASGDFGGDGIRAPMQRTTETLVGGPSDYAGYGPDEAEVLEQLRARQAARRGVVGQPGVFNQRPSVWDNNADENTQREALARATGGASETTAKATKLAELFRPPFELMNQIPFNMARDKGKEEFKWLLVNIQDPSIFDCQQLNRDIWKDEGIRDIIKENFLFMQYSKDDPRGSQYIQYYLQLKDSDSSYPHIAIVDPRTGEQVKVWSGPPIPKAGEFLMQLVEFLDRYSLDPSKKNPVARRKVEKPKAVDVDKLTEEEMLDLAMQNSLAAASEQGPKGHDPDDLTKSSGDVSKGKGKEVEEEPANGHATDTAFSGILSNNPHVEPPQGPTVTRIQFRHSTGRVVRRFDVNDPVRRIYEWLKAEPLEDKEGVAFDIKDRGKDLIEHLDEKIEEAGLKNTSLMVEFLED